MIKCSTLPTTGKIYVKITLRFCFIPFRMTFIKRTNDNECWWECGESGILVHCWWECKLVQPLQSGDSSGNEKWKYHMTRLYYSWIFTQSDLSQHLNDIIVYACSTINSNQIMDLHRFPESEKMFIHVKWILFSHKTKLCHFQEKGCS